MYHKLLKRLSATTLPHGAHFFRGAGVAHLGGAGPSGPRAHGRADVLDFITEEGDGDLKTKREQREHALALANELCDVTGQDPARERIRRSLLKDHGGGSP